MTKLINLCFIRIPFFFEPNFTAQVAPLAAALRLQKDSIQPAYAYVPHTPPVLAPHCHEDPTTMLPEEPAETLAQRLEALLHDPPSSSALHSSASTASFSSGGSEDGGDTRVSTPRTSPPSSFDARRLSASSSLRHGNSHILPHSHHAHTPVSVEKRYAPVIYGEFLMRKVAGNFTPGAVGKPRERY